MLREILSGKLTAKAMALVMAVALWLYAWNRQTERVWLSARLHIEKPADVTLLKAEEVPREVKLHFKGPKQSLERLRYRRLEVRHELEKISGPIEGELRQSLLLTGEDIRVDGAKMSGDVSVLEIAPDKVEIVLATLQESRLRVAIKLVGEPATGHEIISKFVDPEYVTVVGPKVALQSVKDVETMPFDVTGLTEEKNVTFPRVVPLRQEIRQQKGGKMVSIPVECQEKSIKLYLTLALKREHKTFEKVKVQLLTPAGAAQAVKPLKEDTVSVRVRGPKHVLDRMDAASLVAYVEVGTLKPPGPYSEPVRFVLPPGVELDQDPPRVEVDLVIAP